MDAIRPYADIIKLHAKSLKIPTIGRFEPIHRQTQESGWGYEQFLAELLERETANRLENQRKKRVNAARFPLKKSLDSFEFRRLPNVEEALIWQLATGDFVGRHENIIMIGNPGTGITHLAIGLGHRLCQQGYSVRFYTAASLVTELMEAQEARRLTKVEKQLSKVDLLILDEFSYLTFTRPHAELLFHVLSNRNERGSVVVTTNLEFSRWGEMLPEPILTAALIDRLTHHSHVLNMNGDSYRLKERLSKMKGTME